MRNIVYRDSKISAQKLEKFVTKGSRHFRVRQSGRTDDARVIKATDASALPKTTLASSFGDPYNEKEPVS